MLNLRCEMAVGYSHGAWRPMFVDVEIDEDEVSGDLEGDISKAAEAKALRLLEEDMVSFVTMLHYETTEVDA